MNTYSFYFKFNTAYMCLKVTARAAQGTEFIDY